MSLGQATAGITGPLGFCYLELGGPDRQRDAWRDGYPVGEWTVVTSGRQSQLQADDCRAHAGCQCAHQQQVHATPSEIRIDPVSKEMALFSADQVLFVLP